MEKNLNNTEYFSVYTGKRTLNLSFGTVISEVAFGQIPIYLPERSYKSTFPQTLMLKTLDVSALAHFKGLMDRVMPS